MKWILLLLWAGLCPVVANTLKQRPSYVKWAAFAMGLIPFVTGTLHLYIAPIAWPMWPGWPKGIEISALDFLALAVLIGTRSQGKTLKQIWPWLAYLAAVVISLPFAQVFMAGTFYVWQIMRVALVCAAAIRLASYAGGPEGLLKGVFAGLCVQAVLAISQVAGGVTQASGGLASQNMLGAMAHFALFPAFALLLAKKNTGWALAAFGAAVIVDLLTASRATLGLAAIGFAILAVTSIAKTSTSRKFAFVGAGALVIAAMSPFAINAIQSRQATNSVESSNAQRAAMESAAWMIIKDYPFGTGPDQYVVVSNMGGYSARAGVGWMAANRGTAVHNSYLLVWAETGIPGLIAMIVILLLPILASFRAAFRFRREPESELLLGMAVAMTVVAIHLFFEWVFVLFLLQYMFAMISGLTIGMIARLHARAKQAKLAAVTKAAEADFVRGALSPAN